MEAESCCIRIAAGMHSQTALADFVVWAGDELLSNRIKGNAQRHKIGD
jgi:hypothetical protein